MTSDMILALLRGRHSKDIFVSECKDGPSSCTTHLRMDAWAMKRSWANPCMWGYEIKVSRRDFVGDDKWPQYLGLCNQFYFVAPPDLIQPEELGNHVGLLVVAKTGNMLRTIRKAAYREIAPPVALYQYLLMCRCRFVRHDPYEPEGEQAKADFWRRWLADKNATLDLGHAVSRRLADMMSKRICDVEQENKRLTTENRDLQFAAQVLKDLGIYPGHWHIEDEIKTQLDRVRALVPPEIVNSLRTAEESIGRLVKQLTQESESKE